MKPRIRVKRDKMLPERLDEEARPLIEEAAETPPEAYRDLLLRRVNKLEEASRMERRLASSGPRRPT